MKKILGLVVAATALSAVVAVGSASALQLCASGTSDGKCPAGKAEYSGTIEGTSTNAVLTSTVTNITCGDATVKAKASASTGETIAGQVENVTATSCKTTSGAACTVTFINLPYEGAVSGTIEEGHGVLSASDPEGVGAKVVCGLVINCTFSSKEASATILNGSPTTVIASKIPLARAGGICPATAELDATFSATSPAGITVL